MEAEEYTVIVSTTAYIKSLMYFLRFSSEFIKVENFNYAYGLLIGYFSEKDEEVHVTNFIPFKDFSKEYVSFEKLPFIYDNIEELNREYAGEIKPKQVIGWARNSVYNSLEPTLFDKRNHLLFQISIHPKCFFWIFNMYNLVVDDGFRLYTFKEDFKVINITSNLIKMKYQFSNEVDFDDLVQTAIIMEEQRKIKEPLITGIEED